MKPKGSATTFHVSDVDASIKYYDYVMRDFVIEDPDGNLIAIGQES